MTPLKTSEKLTYRPFKLFRDYSNSISLLKVGKLRLELKIEDGVRTQKDTVGSIPFTLERELKIWSFLVVVVQERQQNLQKSVMPDAYTELLLLFVSFYF